MPHSRNVELTESDGPTLLDYLGWLRRRWWILVVCALVGLAGAAGFTATQTKSYTAVTKVLVRPIGPDVNVTTVKVNLDTEAQVIRSLVVADRARRLMNSAEAPESLLRKVSVQVPPNSQVIEVSFESGTPALARDGSHAFTQAYLDLRIDVARRDVEIQVAALDQQIGEINRQLTEIAGRIAALPANSIDRQRAETDKAVLLNQLDTLNNRKLPLANTIYDPGSIITDATLPTAPSSPNRLLNLASGFGAGLLLGIALALLLDRLDTRVRRRRDIADRLGLPVLVELPSKITAVGLVGPADPIARELGRLRNVLLTTMPEKGRGRQLLVSGASVGGGTGFVVGNLAAAYARTGAQVAVLTTNVDSPLAAVVGKHTGPGLADVLRRDVSALKALTAVPSVPQLRVLLPGALDPDAELPVAGLLEVIAELAERFDHVIIETPPPSMAVEAQALASHVDAVLLVAEARHTRSREVTAAMQQFEQVDAPLVGAVLVGHIPAGPRVEAGAPPPVDPAADTVVTPKPATEDPPAKPAAKPAGTNGAKPAESTVVLPRVKPPHELPRTGKGKG